MHGGEWVASANRSAILEFDVDDVDGERERIDAAFPASRKRPPSAK